MARQKKTLDLIRAAYDVLAELHPMTLRQCYYQLVAGQIIKNNESQYNRLGRILADARRDGIIPWKWIEDRTRIPHSVPMWDDREDFAERVLPQFRLDVWQTQDVYVECFLEKDALAGVFEPITNQYGVTLCVCRGYPSASFLDESARRLNEYNNTVVLYWGDHDPSGMDMPRSIRAGLGEFQCYPEISRCALNAEDIETYRLPHDPAKRSDTRAEKFIDMHGDRAVELDALPVNVLRDKIRREIEARLNLDELAFVRERESQERARMARLLAV
jgi:hypothetical protein